MSQEWMQKKAQEMLNEALQVDPQQGTQRLILALLYRMKAEGNPCRGHGSCYVTGRCPFDPVCNN